MSISQILDHDEEVRRRRNFVTFGWTRRDQLASYR